MGWEGGETAAWRLMGRSTDLLASKVYLAVIRILICSIGIMNNSRKSCAIYFVGWSARGRIASDRQNFISCMASEALMRLLTSGGMPIILPATTHPSWYIVSVSVGVNPSTLKPRFHQEAEGYQDFTKQWARWCEEHIPGACQCLFITIMFIIQLASSERSRNLGRNVGYAGCH